MAEKFRVLIVDDHQEIRTALRANLEAFEVDLDLVDVPSGEEAIVEVVGTGIDLLIADVGLPGLTGIELYKKLKHTFPDMQVILITGIDDEEIHQEITDVGAEAFFFKPLKMPEFLNAVRKTIGLAPVENEPEPLVKLTKQNLDKNVTERIADLRGELGAISIMIIEKAGIISAETGIVPDTIYESHVMPLLLRTFSTTTKISAFLGKEKPDSVWYFSGEKYDLFWSHIDVDYGMMVITNPVTQNNDLTWVLTTLDLAIQEVTQIIQNLTEKPATKKKTATAKASSTKTKTADNSKKKTPVKAEIPRKPEQGEKGSKKTRSKPAVNKSKPAAKDAPDTDQTEESEVHEFWKAATLEAEFQQTESADSLSFEQAQKLGFVPGGDKNNS
jgi:DNA-binding NarL/FixJ family response regulator